MADVAESKNMMKIFMKGAILSQVTSLGCFASSLLLIVIFFLNEPLMGSFSAKAYYILGYIVSLFLFSAALLIFPNTGETAGKCLAPSVPETEGDKFDFSEKLRMLVPYSFCTTASFYCYIIGFTAAYWSQLNSIKKSGGSSVYYLGWAFLLYTFVVFVTKTAEWQPSLLSLFLGAIIGLVWSHTVSSLVKGTVEPPPKETDSPQAGGTTTCGSDNNDMVCKAFRV
jgi:hypothetical protein